MTYVFEHILAQDDPFEFVYECISGTHGVAAREFTTQMYNDIVVDMGLHPDDDFERIIELMIAHMEEA